MKPTQEHHGVRPLLVPGSTVKINDHIGIIVEAQANIDGSANDGLAELEYSSFLSDGVTPCRSHAWRPEYSVQWTGRGSPNKCAWFHLEEFDEVFPLPYPETCIPWPDTGPYEETESDCAKYIGKKSS